MKGKEERNANEHNDRFASCHGAGGARLRISYAMKRTKTSLILNRLLAGLGGFIIILLASLPLAFLVYLWVDGGGGGKFTLLALITAIPFGGILAWGVWDVVRRWREVAEVQRMVGEMSGEEREEFYSAAEQGDVELTVDDKGRTRSTPLDFG